MKQKTRGPQPQQIEKLLAHIPDAVIVIAANGLLTYANTAAAALIGKTREQLLGRPIGDLFTDFGESVPKTLRQVIRRQVSDCFEYFAQHVGRWLEVRAYPVPDGVCLFAIDIQERKLIEQRLRESEDQFRQAIENAPIPIMMHTEDGEVLQVSRAFTRITGYTRTDVPTISDWLEQAYGNDAPELARLIADHFARNAAQDETELVIATKTGARRVWRFTTASPGTLADGRRFFTGMATDVTEQHDRVDRLRRAYEQEHEIAESLQGSLLRDLPEDHFDGLQIARVYQAALDEARVGGDFYTTFVYDDCRIALAVGDVSGKGLRAATHTIELITVLRAFLQETKNPADALARLNNFVCAEQGRNEWSATTFATLHFVTVDAVTGETGVLCAGAEPPLLARAGSGEIEPIYAISGPVLGLEPNQEYTALQIRLEPGDTLVLYTDGLTEARRGKDFLGVDGLCDLVRDRLHPAGGNPLSLTDAAHAVLNQVRQFCGGRSHDDACLLFLRRSSPTAGKPAGGKV